MRPITKTRLLRMTVVMKNLKEGDTKRKLEALRLTFKNKHYNKPPLLTASKIQLIELAQLRKRNLSFTQLTWSEELKKNSRPRQATL